MLRDDLHMRSPAAGQDHGATSQANSNEADSATETTNLQVRRICRVYAVSFATAATIARLAYAVGAP
jgi:hypothetical protein